MTNPGTPLVDDRAAHAGVDHQLPHAQHARRSPRRRCSRTCTSRRSSTRGSSSAFQVAIMLQPICGYVLDVRRAEDRVRASSRSPGRSSAWRTGWRAAGRRSPACAGCWASPKARRIPAGHEGDVGMVSGARSADSPAASSTSARRSARCSRRRSSRGRSSTYNWQFAFVHHRRARPRVGRALAAGSIESPGEASARCRPRSATTSLSGQESAPARRRATAVDR